MLPSEPLDGIRRLGSNLASLLTDGQPWQRSVRALGALGALGAREETRSAHAPGREFTYSVLCCTEYSTDYSVRFLGAVRTVQTRCELEHIPLPWDGFDWRRPFPPPFPLPCWTMGGRMTESNILHRKQLTSGKVVKTELERTQ